MLPLFAYCFFFFFNDTATTEIYTLSLHDALPISRAAAQSAASAYASIGGQTQTRFRSPKEARSEEHTSELQSRPHLVCRLLLEKKKKRIYSDWCAVTDVSGQNTRSCQHVAA